ncbi:DeoR/GlpR family DNA-binding transcription regulator [Bowmanella sp. Y26]|uniref:DeoR/GlpR family DNA-binding transcription regulator n=1 Tax=Bowmanella yangjiangensis TaxID=2811230 RepID=UPI001BDD05D0|nr:DeoR/GlpR family DNA-binding transcription regulator [Bowmanella yangjiangensis]MBT1062436.1 DeoR/GlpR family DNA-binding transcription regulator [Bowmanella yangjiangensis]
MLLAERQSLILKELNDKGRVYAADLALQLGVSEDTVRRDLNRLGELQLLRRVHGGALPLQLDVPDYADRLELKHPDKQKRATAALNYLQAGQTILLDSGETCLYLAKALPRDMRLTVVTACPLIACELMHHDKADVIVVGGSFFKPALRSVGAVTCNMLRKMRFDIYFTGACALHPERGFTAKYMEEAEVMRISVEQSDRTVVMGGPDRLGLISNHQVANIRDLDVLITDLDADATMVQALQERNLQVVQV